MVQTKKIKGNLKKKTTRKHTSRFYVVNTVQQTRENLLCKLEEYNQKLINDPLENGKKMANSLKKQPRKTVAGLFDDGKEYITDLNKETRNKVNGVVKEGRSFLAKAGKAPRKTVSRMIDDGKELVEDLQKGTHDRLVEVVGDYKSMINGIGRDTRLIAEELIGGGFKAFDKLPGKQKLEKAVSIRLQEVPNLLNLPSQKEVESLVNSLNKLDIEVAALSKAQAG